MFLRPTYYLLCRRWVIRKRFDRKNCHSFDQFTTNTTGLYWRHGYYPTFSVHAERGQDVVIAETGTFYNGMAEVRLPGNVTYIGQGGWQSIGYAIPSAFGAIMAAPERQYSCTGDGALQLTAQEISSMLYYGTTP